MPLKSYAQRYRTTSLGSVVMYHLFTFWLYFRTEIYTNKYPPKLQPTFVIIYNVYLHDTFEPNMILIIKSIIPFCTQIGKIFTQIFNIKFFIILSICLKHHIDLQLSLKYIFGILCILDVYVISLYEVPSFAYPPS